jgi:hypothetical protein
LGFCLERVELIYNVKVNKTGVKISTR